MSSYPTPHLEKLNATLINDKLPAKDVPRIKDAINRYSQWIAACLPACYRSPRVIFKGARKQMTKKTKARSKYQPKLNTVITSVLRPAKEPTQAEIEAQAA